MPSTNASTLELTWSAIAVLGAGFTAALLVHVWLSFAAVLSWVRQHRAVAWGPRYTFALGFLVGVALLLLVWCGFVALGVNAMLNPAPTTPDREAASERGGWILVSLEAVLFLFQLVLLWAWVSVGRPSLKPGLSTETTS